MDASIENSPYFDYYNQFKNDVFISYTRTQPDQASETGWIKDFHTRLYCEMADFLSGSRRPEIFRDDDMEGNTPLPRIFEEVRYSAVFVAVLTERHKDSKWCQEETKKFYEIARETIGEHFNNKDRVFKVLKVPVDIGDQHPPELRDLKGYQFFEREPGKPKARRFYRRDHSEDSPAKFNEQILFIAQDICLTIKALQKEVVKSEKENSKPDNKQLTIYLPQPTSDLLDAYEKLKYQLQDWGYKILPGDRSLPKTDDAIRAAVREYLNCCTLSVHLIGQFYGSSPEDNARESVMKIQHDLAEERGESNHEFSRLIWMPPNLKSDQEEQSKFIETLKNFSNSLLNPPEVLTNTTLEDCKTFIHDTIQAKLRSSERTAKQDESRRVSSRAFLRRIYLMCHKSDEGGIHSLVSRLEAERLKVIRPIFEDDFITLEEVQKRHQYNLGQADAILLYWGRVSKNWLEATLQDLEIAASNRSNSFLLTGLCKGEPLTDEKHQFKRSELDHIFHSFMCKSFINFLARLRVQGDGSLC